LPNLLLLFAYVQVRATHQITLTSKSLFHGDKKTLREDTTSPSLVAAKLTLERLTKLGTLLVSVIYMARWHYCLCWATNLPRLLRQRV